MGTIATIEGRLLGHGPYLFEYRAKTGASANQMVQKQGYRVQVGSPDDRNPGCIVVTNVEFEGDYRACPVPLPKVDAPISMKCEISSFGNKTYHNGIIPLPVAAAKVA